MELDDRSHYADRLREAAALLVAQGANPFRAAAYRNAADTIMGLTEDVTTIIDRDGAARNGLAPWATSRAAASRNRSA